MDEADISVQITWPDGDNLPRDRVQVAVEYEHAALIPGLFPWGPLPLRSSTTMRIVN